VCLQNNEKKLTNNQN